MVIHKRDHRASNTRGRLRGEIGLYLHQCARCKMNNPSADLEDPATCEFCGQEFLSAVDLVKASEKPWKRKGKRNTL